MSLATVLPKVYPKHYWEPWRLLTPLPPNFWTSKQNQRQFMNRLGVKLGFHTAEHWYSLTARDIRENGGEGLLAVHKNSLLEILKTSFYRYKWYPWKLAHVPKDWWQYKDHHRQFLEWLATQKRRRKRYSNKLEALYDLSYSEIANNGGMSFIWLGRKNLSPPSL